MYYTQPYLLLFVDLLYIIKALYADHRSSTSIAELESLLERFESNSAPVFHLYSTVLASTISVLHSFLTLFLPLRRL